MNTEQTMDSLAPKVDAFALTLSAPEQVLLTELIAGGARTTATRFGARPIWPGLENLISSVELGPEASTSGDGSRQPTAE